MLLLFATLYTGRVAPALAQNVTVRGFTVDVTSREPLPGVSVVLSGAEGLVRGTASDKNGYFQINGISAGIYVLSASFIGYGTVRDTLTLGDERIRTLTIALAEAAEELDEVVVTEKREIMQNPGVQTIRPEDLKRLPTSALGGDLAAYLQFQRGVVSAGDRGGQLFVRGGTPDQNLVLVDGNLIYQPFHIIGFFSAFPQDIVSYVETYAGGFGARYSGRISSVIDVSTRDGNKLSYAGMAALSPFLSAVQAEGPLQRGKVSFLASFRRSLISETAPVLLGQDLPFSFNDAFLKLHASVDNRYRCGVTAIRTADRGTTVRGDSLPDADFRWTNVSVGGQCLALPSESRTRLDLNTGVSYISNRFKEAGDLERASHSLQASMELNFTSVLSPSSEALWGLFTRMNWIGYDLREFLGIRVANDVLFNTGGYVEGHFRRGDKWKVNAGIAATFDPGSYSVWLEPRLSAIWRPGGGQGVNEFSAAIGLYRQTLEGVSDERDAGAVFVAWMPGPVNGKEAQAAHLLLGWKRDLGADFRIGAEGYLKRITNLPVPIYSAIARFTTTLTLAKGSVRGVDAWAEYDHAPFYAYLGYGLSHTIYTAQDGVFGEWFGEPVRQYTPPHDRRHQVSAILSYARGAYRVNAAWQFGTGLPFTRTLGFDELIPLQSLYDVRSRYGITRVVYEKPYLGRLPAYHRLDISAGRTFDIGRAKLTLQLGAINLYDRANLLYFDLFTFRRLNQLPLFPYVSFKLESR
ncbi:MAG TPA: TonB-dependent receptor [Rhodothermales bacterium]|nr:TonB-dependent receptor [Rhodothermales bacterium]